MNGRPARQAAGAAVLAVALFALTGGSAQRVGRSGAPAGDGGSGGPAAGAAAGGAAAGGAAAGGAAARAACSNAPAAAASATGPGTVSTMFLPAPDAPGGRREVWVYRPPGADSATLPVLYLLHGLPGSAGDFAGAVPYLDTLGAALGRFVIAAPDGTVPGLDDPEWGDSVDGAARLTSFITGPLIAAVEGCHRRSAAYRALGGFSMGGYGAMNIGLGRPDLYGQLVSIDGYFRPDDPDHVFGTGAAQLVAATPDLHAADARGRRVLLIDGRQDTVAVTRGQSAPFAATLSGAGVDVTFRAPAGHHTLAFVDRQFPELTAFLDAGWGHAGAFLSFAGHGPATVLR